MHFTTISTIALTLAASALAAPAAKPSKAPSPALLQIKGIPKKVTNETVYLAYQPNFFGDLALGITTDSSSAETFNVLANKTLESVSGMTIALEAPWYDSSTSAATEFVNSTGTEGTYVENQHHFKVVNTDPDFGSWLVCYSQYGAGIEWATPAYNETAANQGYPFPCFKVGFHAVPVA